MRQILQLWIAEATQHTNPLFKDHVDMQKTGLQNIWRLVHKPAWKGQKDRLYLPESRWEVQKNYVIVHGSPLIFKFVIHASKSANYRYLTSMITAVSIMQFPQCPMMKSIKNSSVVQMYTAFKYWTYTVSHNVRVAHYVVQDIFNI